MSFAFNLSNTLATTKKNINICKHRRRIVICTSTNTGLNVRFLAGYRIFDENNVSELLIMGGFVSRNRCSHIVKISYNSLVSVIEVVQKSFFGYFAEYVQCTCTMPYTHAHVLHVICHAS